MSGLGKLALSVLIAGWLADLLAGHDRDVEAGITAYEAGELETSLSHFDAAVDRHGERAELQFDRGLVLMAQGETESARKALERASESDDPTTRSSALYELGNLAFDAEDYEGAITAYIECLKARPEHDNAKWNLELALLKKQEKDKEDEQDEDKDEEEDESDGDESGGDESGGDESDGGESDGGGSDGGGSDGGESDGGESGQGDSGGEPPQEDQSDQGEEPPPEPPDAAQPPPEPLRQMDIEKALQELDDQDPFLMGRPTGRQKPPAQDW